ncbi:Type I restriction-modification system, specificity subunit S [Methanosarcina lacustris Z-7289]|uniref:Type I restriction-modification system, specificity subunit S n=1 Tax=Methanosarcina lacustris Z-7289 TaxID=1434111 RepID=A0A0E3S2I5_9EURY|nr:restriction endonuclease subunit S [Methanosarcina lacustris]AKB75019.1 Type I restriction-modification system, specificity subunit S [Methanosarcina lacustris Z-7289]
MENKLPEGWEWKKLGEIAIVEKKVILPEDIKGTYQKYIGLENIEKDTGRLTSFSETLGDEIKSNKYRFTVENILYGKLRPYLNKVYLPDFEGICSTDILTIKTVKGKAIREYVALLMRQPFFVSYANTRSSGANLPRINESKVLECKVPVPSLETQKKIVAILEKAEETKKLRAQADELTQKLLQSVFLEMFGDPVTNPMGWNTEKLKKLCVKIFGGGTPSKSKPEYYEGNIPWVTPKDMKQDFIQDSIDHISEKAIEESSTKLIPPYSLLMVIRSGILKNKLPVAINICKVTMNQDMKGFVFDNKLTNPFFMLHYFKIYQRDLLNRVRSVTADNLEFNQIKDIDVILPPIGQQQRFATIVEQMEKTGYSQQQSSLEINNLFDALMQKAFTGELVS